MFIYEKREHDAAGKLTVTLMGSLKNMPTTADAEVMFDGKKSSELNYKPGSFTCCDGKDAEANRGKFAYIEVLTNDEGNKVETEKIVNAVTINGKQFIPYDPSKFDVDVNPTPTPDPAPAPTPSPTPDQAPAEGNDGE